MIEVRKKQSNLPKVARKPVVEGSSGTGPSDS